MDIVIVWIAPWVAIYLVDWVMRKWRYVPERTPEHGRTTLYWSSGGVLWPAIVAQLVGMFAAISALSPDLHRPAAG